MPEYIVIDIEEVEPLRREEPSKEELCRAEAYDSLTGIFNLTKFLKCMAREG